MRKYLTLGLVLSLGLIIVGCGKVKEDVYDQSLSNEDVAIVDEIISNVVE